MVRHTPPVTPLLPSQEVAALAPIGPVLIHGGVGTGKTHTIAARIAIWLKNGENASQIACVTPSAGGSNVFYERVRKFLPPDHSGFGCFFGTPKTLALKILRCGGMQALGRSADFSVWHSHEALEYITLLLGTDPRKRRRLRAEADRILQWHRLNLAAYSDEHIPPAKS